MTRPGVGIAPTRTDATRVDATRVDALSAFGRAPIIVRPAPARSLPGSRRTWVIGALAAAMLLAVFIAVPLVRDAGTGDAGDRNADRNTAAPLAAAGSASAGSPSAAPPSEDPSPSAAEPTGPPPLPAGWHLHSDPTGFNVPVPNGWRVRRESTGPAPDQVRVYFSEPNGHRMLLIDQTNQPEADPVTDWQSKESYRRTHSRNYQRVGEIHAVDYWKSCADWEWLETRRDGTRIHVRNRGFITAKDKAYAIRWDTPEAVWQANLANFDIIAKGFVPARVD